MEPFIKGIGFILKAFKGNEQEKRDNREFKTPFNLN